MGHKIALIIGNSEYDDQSLARLITPAADVNDLANTLKSPDIGGFDEVITLVNEPASALRRSIARLFTQKTPNDLLLLYFSGHGVLDDQGQLYLAVKDTERELLSGTAIPATFITSEMDRSRSKRQVLILDCCHSGAFARGAKGVGTSVGTGTAFEGTGYGRVVLTATDATQYAWEGDQVIGQADNSVFTHFLIHGLQSGEADANADGTITLDELYDYVYEQVRTRTPKQTPGKWSYKQQGDIVIAKSRRLPQPAALPIELQQSIEDARPWVREGAVRELDRLLNGSNTGLVLAAFEALKRLTDDDSRNVSSAASIALNTYTERQRAKEVQERLEAGRPATPAVEHERWAQPAAEDLSDTAKRMAALVVKARLVVRQGPLMGKMFALRSGENIIGRADGLNITLPDRLISRRNTRINVQGDEATVEDLDSANGTSVNGQKITGSYALKAGDVITVGDTMLAFEVEAAAPEALAPTTTTEVSAGPALVQPTIVLSKPKPEPAAPPIETTPAVEPFSIKSIMINSARGGAIGWAIIMSASFALVMGTVAAVTKVGIGTFAQVSRTLIAVTLGSAVGGAVGTAIAAGISGWLLQSLKPALDPRRWRRSTLEWSAITAVTADALGVLSAIGYSGYKPPPGVWLNLAPLIEPFMLWVFGLGLGGLVASVRLGILLRRKIPKLSKIRMLVIDAGWLIGLIVACIVSGLAAALVMNMTA